MLSHVHVGTVCLVTLRHWDSCVCKVRVRAILHYPATVALELYSYHRFNRKQVMWQSDKRDEEEGELTHSQDSREPDGATVSWQDCQHTSHRGLCVCVHLRARVSVCIWENTCEFPCVCLHVLCMWDYSVYVTESAYSMCETVQIVLTLVQVRERAYVSVSILRLSLSRYRISLLCVLSLRYVCVFVCLHVPVLQLEYSIAAILVQRQGGKLPITQPGLCLPLHMATESLGCLPGPLPLRKSNCV